MVLKWLAVGFGGVVLLLLAAAVYGWFAWNRETLSLVGEMEGNRAAPKATRFDSRELDGLPAPVRAYFMAALKEGTPIVTAVTVRHHGTFNMSGEGEDWKPFTSDQRVLTQRPGFVWDGRVAMMPGLTVYVHDAYVAGRGLLHPSILGLFPIARIEGSGDVAQGEFMRYLAESAWYPTALLPSQGVAWQAIDDHSARATLSDGDVSVTLTFTFGPDHLIRSARAEARGRTVDNLIVATPWEGTWSDYRMQDGMMIPMAGEVSWLLPEGRKPYWRGMIEKIEYEFAPKV